MALKGIAIGNGWIDGRYQYPAYYDFAIKSNLIKANSATGKNAQEAVARCNIELNKTREFIPVNYAGCDGVMGAVTQGLMQTIDGKQMCLNVYDVRLSDDYPACGMNWPPDLGPVTNYLARRDVILALHAQDKSETWTECQGAVYGAFNVKNSPASVTLLPGILEKIPVMLFAGDQDLICNYVGVESVIEHLEWQGATGLGDAPTLPWKVNGTDAGSWRTARNLTYVKVFGASHMVGFDLPEVAHDMMLRFMGVDFSLGATVGQGARLGSVVGEDVRPAVVIPSTTTSEGAASPGSTGISDEDKAQWEAYYNAGSAALIFILIALAIGLFIYFRKRRETPKGVSLSRESDFPEETIPLQQGNGEQELGRRRKGKAREVYDESPSAGAGGDPIFDVGDDEDSGDERVAGREFKDRR